MTNTLLSIIMSIAPISDTVTVILSLLGGLVGLVSVIFVGIQLWQKVRSDHAKHVAEMMDKTQTKEMLDLFAALDYGKFVYDGKFHGGNNEHIVDNLLHHYEYVLYLKERRMLNKSEFRFFEYNIQRVVGNVEMQNYLFNLYHYGQIGKLSFKYMRLLNYGIENGFIDSEEFEKNGSHTYSQVLFY